MEDKKITSIELVLFYSFVFMFMYAVSTYMYSTLMPTIREAYGMNETSASLLTVSTSIGSLIITGLSALFLDRFDKNTSLGVSVVLYGVLFILFSMVPPLTLFLFLKALDGMFSYLVMNLSSAYVSDIYGEKRNQYIPILHTLYAAGAIVAPKYAAWKIRNIASPAGWGVAYSVIGWLTLIFGIAYLITFRFVKKPVVMNKEKGVHPFAYVKTVLKNRNVISLCLSNLFMSGFFFFTNWLTTYFASLGSASYTPSVYASIMSMYSVGMLLGVAASGYLAGKLGAERCVRLMCILCLILCLFALRENQVWIWMGVMLAVGFAEGPYVTYIALLGLREFPEYSATVTSLTSVFTCLGSIIITPLMGRIAQSCGYGLTMVLSVFFLVIVYLIQLLLYKKRG